MKKKATVLIVDDVPGNLDIVKQFLHHDYRLLFAINGVIALKIINEQPPDLILLDIMMPEMDGFETIRRIKETPNACNIPIIFLTAKSETEDIVTGFKLGAVDYITKPFRQEELAVRVKTHLNLRTAEIALRQALEDAEAARDRAEKTLAINLEMQKKLDDDLAAGAAMQKKFLISQDQAKKILNHVRFDLSVYNCPYTTVSGDFFYPKRLNQDAVGLFFADACGHGLPAALISMRLLGLLQSLPATIGSAAEYLQTVNRDIEDVMPPGRFIAAAYLILHNSGTVQIANSGQPYPILISQKKVEPIPISGPPIGILPILTISETSLRLNPGDKLALYSDGITDITNESDEPFGEERLLTFFRENATLSADDMKDQLIRIVNQFIGNTPPNDDVTLMIVAFQGATDD